MSKKSLRVLDKKLQHLHEHADFDVNINSVLGGGIKNPEDARTINNRARELGFSTSIGIIHDGSGRLKPLGAGRAQGVRRGVGRDQRRRGRCSRTSIRASAASRTTSPTASRTSGAAAPARATCTSARTAWCTTARSSAAIPGVPLDVVHDRRHPARVRRRRSRARRTARSAASTASRRWISGASRRSRSPASPQGSVTRSVLIHAWPIPPRSTSRPASICRKSTTPSTRRARKSRSATTSRARARRSSSIATTTPSTLTADDDFKMNALWEILQGRLVRRGVPTKNLTPRRDRARRQRHGPARRHAAAGHSDRSGQGHRQVPQGPQAEEGAGGDPGRPGARLVAVEGRAAGGDAAAARTRFRRRAAVRQLPRLRAEGPWQRTALALARDDAAGRRRPALRRRLPTGVRRRRRTTRPAGQPRRRRLMAEFRRAGRRPTCTLHREARERRIPALPKEATPEQIDAHQRALGRADSEDARQGQAGRHLHARRRGRCSGATWRASSTARRAAS